MKKGILSVTVAIIGFYIVYRYNSFMYTISSSLLSEKEIRLPLISDLFSFNKLFKIVTISIGLLSLYLGVVSYTKKNKLGLIGLVLGVFLIFSTFIPFWEYLIEDSTRDINIK